MQEKQADNGWVFFLITGFSYLIYLVAMRWKYQFDVFENRLLAPFTLMMLFALLNYCLQYKALAVHVRNVMVTVMVVSFIYFVPIGFFKKDLQAFTPTWNLHKNHYQNIPKNSVIIFGNFYLLYYNANIQLAAPFPYYGRRILKRAIVEEIIEGENLQQFVDRLCTQTSATNIYINADGGKSDLAAEQKIREKEGQKPLDISFANAMQDKSGLVLLKTCLAED